MAHIKESIYIQAPPGEVVDTSNLHSWPIFVTSMTAPHVIAGDGGVGTRFEIFLTVAGLRLRESGRVVDVRHDSDGGVHWQNLFKGPLSGWQRWDLRPADGGTSVTLEMSFVVLGGVGGKMAEALLFTSRAARDARHSLGNLKRLVEERDGRGRLSPRPPLPRKVSGIGESDLRCLAGKGAALIRRDPPATIAIAESCPLLRAPDPTTARVRGRSSKVPSPAPR